MKGAQQDACKTTLAFLRGGSKRLARGPYRNKHMVSSGSFTDRARDSALEALLKLSPGVQRPDRLPSAVWQELKKELPTGSLRTFLNDHPDVLEVIELPGSERLTFVIKGGTGSTRPDWRSETAERDA